MQTVMKIATLVSVLAACVMLAYGTSCLTFLADIEYMHPLFDSYGLILGGVAVLLSASVGTWSAATIHKSVLRIHYRAIVPAVTALLLAFCFLAFADFGETSVDVPRHYSGMSTALSLETVQLKIQTQLLVTGILCLFVCIFQAATFVASRQLHHSIELLEIENEEHAILRALREKELGIYGHASSQPPTTSAADPSAEDPYFSKYSAKMLGRIYLRNSRGNKDRFVICWATITGLLDIFVSGTFVVLSFVGVSVKSQWEFAIWSYLGASDARFLNSDSFLVCSELLKAVVLGPMLLLFAWATFVFAPYRHVLGIVVAAIHVYNWVVYYVMEVQSGSADMHGEDYPAITAMYVFLSFLFSVLLPLYVLVRETRAAVWDTNMNDSNKMRSEMGAEGDRSAHNLTDLEDIKDKSQQLRRRKKRQARSGSTGSHTGLYRGGGGDGDGDTSHQRATTCMSSETVDILRIFPIQSDVEMGVNFELGGYPEPDSVSHPHPLHHHSSENSSRVFVPLQQSRLATGSTRESFSGTNSLNDSSTMKSSSPSALALVATTTSSTGYALQREQRDGSIGSAADRALGLDLDSEDVDMVAVFGVAGRTEHESNEDDEDADDYIHQGGMGRDRSNGTMDRGRGGSRERGSSVALTAPGDEEKQEDGSGTTLRPSQSQLSLTVSPNLSDAGSARTTNRSLKKKLSASGSVMTV